MLKKRAEFKINEYSTVDINSEVPTACRCQIDEKEPHFIS
jgi:hypothetical protein